jgi:ATP-dependent Lon protease
MDAVYRTDTNFLEVYGDIVERVDPIFYADPLTAAMKALGIT